MKIAQNSILGFGRPSLQLCLLSLQTCVGPPVLLQQKMLSSWRATKQQIIDKKTDKNSRSKQVQQIKISNPEHLHAVLQLVGVHGLEVEWSDPLSQRLLHLQLQSFVLSVFAFVLSLLIKKFCQFAFLYTNPKENKTNMDEVMEGDQSLRTQSPVPWTCCPGRRGQQGHQASSPLI